MSANGTRRIVWANGEDDFCIAKVTHIFDLEDRCKAGIGAIVQRLENGSYYLNDVRETIRLGLIGGGMAPDAAMTAVKRHVDDLPIAHSVLLAYEVLCAALVGVEGDPVGKKREAEAVPESSIQTDASADRPSSAPEPDSAGRQEKPSSAPSGSFVPPLTDTTSPMAPSRHPIP